jgi:hypothetical protein
MVEYQNSPGILMLVKFSIVLYCTVAVSRVEYK